MNMGYDKPASAGRLEGCAGGRWDLAKKQTTSVVNVTAGKRAVLSSGSQWSTPDDATAVFEDSDRNFSFHTEKNEFPYLIVDLEAVHAIETIKLFNRKDGFQFCARTIIVEISMDGLSWEIVHSGTVFWKGAFVLPLSGAVKARYVRLRLNERQYFHLDKVEVNARVFSDYGEPVVVANRTDGLGERLNAMLNALWMSELCDAGFRFTWSDRFADDLTHAIVPAERMFGTSFLADHLIAEEDAAGIWPQTEMKRSFDSIRWTLSQTGMIASPRALLTDVVTDMPDADASALQRAFRRIEFSPEVNHAIAVARDTKIRPGAVALHLRSGDIFFGEYRKYLNYTYKGITLPIAKEIVRHFVGQGQDVYIFGQDSESIAHIAQSCGGIDSDTLNTAETAKMERHQKAIYDVVLLSRFATIVGGSSGFSRQASWIGGGTVLSPQELFPASVHHAVSMSDLAGHASTYHPMHLAFGYWYAFFYGRKGRPPGENIALLEKAIAFDPDNELYYFVLSSLLARNGDEARSGEVLRDLFAVRHASGNLKVIFAIFTARTFGKYNVAEFFKPIEDLAASGRFFHAALVCALEKSRKNPVSAEKTLEICRQAAVADAALKEAVLDFLAR